MGDPHLRTSVTIKLPLISVYIATRNRESLLQRAMSSVLSQSYPNLELLVVDDASTDGTSRVLASWSKRDPRVRFSVLGAPAGAPVARNQAIRMATGDFVTGLDDDDIFLPQRLELFLSHWQTLKPDQGKAFLYSQTRAVGPGGAVESRMPAQATVDLLCVSNCIGNQVFAPRQAFLSAGGFTEGLPAWQDLDLWLSMMRLGLKGYLVDEVTMELDASPRGDRISDQARTRIEAARDALLARHVWLSHAQRRDLYLQSLSRHYNFNILWRDVAKVWRLDPTRQTTRRVLSLWWRRLRGR